MDEELRRTIRRNQLLGMWAAEKLGLKGPEADAYAKSDDEILSVMSAFMLQAASGMQSGHGGSADAAALALARNLIRR